MDDVDLRLTRCVRQHLRFLGEGQALDDSIELKDLGLDSMSAISLLQDLEQTFRIRFPDAMIVEDTFRSVRSLARAIRSLLPGAPP